jgi:hypothetical protein
VLMWQGLCTSSVSLNSAHEVRINRGFWEGGKPFEQKRFTQVMRVVRASSGKGPEPARTAGNNLPHTGPSMIAATRPCGSSGYRIPACTTVRTLAVQAGHLQPYAVQMATNENCSRIRTAQIWQVHRRGNPPGPPEKVQSICGRGCILRGKLICSIQYLEQTLVAYFCRRSTSAQCSTSGSSAWATCQDLEHKQWDT